MASPGLALADRFLIYALFQGELLNFSGLSSLRVLTAMGRVGGSPRSASWASIRWRYRRTSPFAYTECERW